MANNKVIFNNQTLIDLTDTTATAADVASGKYFYTNAGVRTQGTASSGGVNIGTATVTASNYPTQINFTNLSGEPKAFFVKSTTNISSSGSTTYYYIIAIRYDGTNYTGTYFRVGNTRQTSHVTSGYSAIYKNNTLTVSSSAASRSASPGAFYNGSYELTYVY